MNQKKNKYEKKGHDSSWGSIPEKRINKKEKNMTATRYGGRAGFL